MGVVGSGEKNNTLFSIVPLFTKDSNFWSKNLHLENFIKENKDVIKS